MRFLTALLFLGLLSGCAMDDFFVGDDYDDDFLDSELVIYEGTSPGYHNFVPGNQHSQPAPTAPPPMSAQPMSAQPVSQTKEPPI